MKLRTLFMTSLLSLFPLVSVAWNGMGHMLVSQIAYDNLTPHTKKQVDELSSIVGRSYSKVNHFVAGAPWPDDIKGEGITEYNTWHYINVGFSDDGTQVPTPPVPNVITGITDCVNALQSPLVDAKQKAFALLMLSHLVGDLHQPMHSITKFSHDLPQGDAGGNGFKLKGKYKNLHSLWDAAVEYYPSAPSRPLNSKSVQSLTKEATNIVDTFFVANDPRFEITHPAQWVEETYSVGREYVYNGIRKNQYPSHEYKEIGSQVAREQIYIAGFRLAKLLNTIFDEKK